MLSFVGRYNRRSVAKYSNSYHRIGSLPCNHPQHVKKTEDFARGIEGGPEERGEDKKGDDCRVF